MNRTNILRKSTARYVRGGYTVFSCLVAMRSSADEHSAAAAEAATAVATTLNSTRTATPDSSTTRTPVVAVVVLLRIARAALKLTSIMSRFYKI